MVRTSAPITADAATVKTVGVGKTITYNAKAKVKKVSVKDKTIVTAKKSGKKVTIKGKKAGKTTVTVKSTKKTVKLTVKVGATKITKKSVTTSMNVGETKDLKVTATNGKGDTIKFTSSDKATVKVNKASAKANSKMVAGTTVTALKAGTAKITATSKNTGKKKTFTIAVVDAAPTVTPSTNPAIVATTPAVTTTVTPGGNQGGTTSTTAPQTTTGAATNAPGTSENPSTTGAVSTETPTITTPGATDVTSTDAPTTTDVVNTVAPDTTEVPNVTTTPAITATPSAVEFTAKQTGRNTITVIGEALTSVTTDYVIKKGKTEFSVDSVVVSDDKTSAKITLASTTMSAGDYTITFADDSVDFTAEAENMEKIEIVGNNLVVDAQGRATETATIYYHILNQFGERMTSSNISATCTLGKAGVKTGSATTRTSDGVIEVTLATDTTIGVTKGSLVLVDTQTGKSATAEVVVSSKSTIASVKVAGVYKLSTLTEATLKSGEANPENYAILLKAYDQYGNETTTIDGKSGNSTKNVTITLSGTTGLDITGDDSWGTVDIDDEAYIAIPFDSLVSGSLSVGTTTVTIVGDSIGLLSNFTVSVAESTSVTSLKINPADTLYVGTKTEVEYEAYDNEGNLVTDYNALKETTLETNNSDFKWVRQKDGSAKLYITPSQGANNTIAVGDTLPTGKNAITKAVDTSIGNNVNITPVTIYAQKLCTNILGLSSTVTKAALKDGNEIAYHLSDFVIADQYGNTMSATEVAADTAKYIKITLTDDSNGKAFEEAIVKTAAFGDYSNYTSATDSAHYIRISDINATADYAFAVKTTAAEGTAKVEFSLAGENDGSDDYASSEYTTSLKSTDIEKVSGFEIGTVPALYIGALSDGTDKCSAGVPVTVTGKVGGLTVDIPSSMFTVIATSEHIKADAAAGEIKAVIPTGADASDIGSNASVKENLVVAINNKAGDTVTKEVTVSNVAPTITSVDSDSFAISYEKGTAKTIAPADITGLLTVKDQYGNYAVDSVSVTNETPRIKYTNIPDGFTVADNNTTKAVLTAPALASLSAEKTFTVGVELTYENGVIYTDTLVVTVTMP